MRIDKLRGKRVIQTENAVLKDLNKPTRKEVLTFLKRLWNEEKTNCPICGSELEFMHKKSKEKQLRLAVQTVRKGV